MGTALSVDLTYFGGQFANGDGVTLVWRELLELLLAGNSGELTFGGRIIGGGG